jgi:hypothetical protein
MAQANIPLFCPPAVPQVSQRFDHFIEWAIPFGLASINTIHAIKFDLNAPYFDWAESLLEHGDNMARSWFLKYEYLSRGRSVFKRTRKDSQPEILDPNGLIPSGRFLKFAKAYINVICFYRNLRSWPKSLMIALPFLEKALRDQTGGDNDPVNLKHTTFERAIRLLQESNYGSSKKYDTAKELEILANMLQNGHNSKTFRFAGKGFRILKKPFAFSAGIALASSSTLSARDSPDLDERPSGRVTSEMAAAVGLAYRKATSRYGKDDQRTFISAIAGLAFTTVSMRISDLLTLQRDAVYCDRDSNDRYRIRVGRPKIDVSQNLPISKKLGPLAYELFEVVYNYSKGAHEALSFYIEKFREKFDSINELFIPEDLHTVFSNEYLTISQTYQALRAKVPKGKLVFPKRLKKIEPLFFIDTPDDIWSPGAQSYRLTTDFCTILEIETAAREANFLTTFPLNLSRQLFVNKVVASKYMKGYAIKKRSVIDLIFKNSRRGNRYIRCKDLRAELLSQFKQRSGLIHWPYTSKDSNVMLDKALLVCFETDVGRTQLPGENKYMWWCPSVMTASNINRWISSTECSEAILFKALDVKLQDGEYPSITLHGTRKYHHTVALLAGAHEVFIDELAGRRNGRQSQHYDKRTAHEIVTQSIETFDPDIDFDVAGPIAARAEIIKLVDRKDFLYKNAVPKHVTDIGGCATDWSLDPCKQYGDCTRCDQQLWRKGDVLRLSNIHIRRNYAMEMIAMCEKKILSHQQIPRSIQLQLQQFKDDISRCDAILAIEIDPLISIGTIVTFDSAPKNMTISQRTSLLKKNNNDRET